MSTIIAMRKSEVGELRPSQLLHTFGVGSIVDLPNLSVMVMGLEDWPIAYSNEITEERLLGSVKNILGRQVSRLLTAPRAEETHGSQANWFDESHTTGVPVAPVPRWMVCAACRLFAPLSSGLFEPKVVPFRPDKACYVHSICPKSKKPAPVVPARFLVACSKGHLDDFPWLDFIHKGKQGCPGPLRLYEVGPTGRPRMWNWPAMAARHVAAWPKPSAVTTKRRCRIAEGGVLTCGISTHRDAKRIMSRQFCRGRRIPGFR